MDAVQEAEQVLVIEAARAYVAAMTPIDLTDNGRLVGHLMTAEVLLKQIVAAFDDPAAKT